MRRFVDGSLLDNFIMVVILLNVLVMCMYRFDNPPELDAFINISNDVCSFIFAMEFTLKVCVMGPLRYFDNGFNCFDFTLVFVSMVTFVVENATQAAEGALLPRFFTTPCVGALRRATLRRSPLLKQHCQTRFSGLTLHGSNS